MPKIQRESIGAKVKYEVWEENFFLGAAPSYVEAEKIQTDFNLYKQEFLRNYQTGKVPVKYEMKKNAN